MAEGARKKTVESLRGWAVIADDLTGAADTGIQFLPLASPLYLVDGRRGGGLDFDPEPGGIAVYTGTRALSAGQSAAILLPVARAVARAGFRRVYKKIDSALRGPIGAEIEAVLEALGAKASFIAPAFPAQGRTTEDGIHRLHGRPIAETEMARDPLVPVSDSRLATRIARTAAKPVAHLSWKVLDGGEESAARAVARLLGEGAVHVCFDALEERHLEAVARLFLHRFPEVLPCGAAGLAAAIVRMTASRPPGPTEAPPPPRPPGGGFLWVCGSASERLRAQAERLCASGGVHGETLSAVILGGPSGSADGQAVLERAAERLARMDVLIRLPPPAAGPKGADPDSLAQGLSRFVAALVARVSPRGLFLSGGDTAAAVLARLDAPAVRLEREIESGVALGRIAGGRYDGLAVVTKAGSFGGPEVLLEVRRRLS